MFRNPHNQRSGQMLLEALVAASVGVVGLLGVLSLLTQSIVVNRQTSERFIATYLAAEGIEVMRSIVDKNYTDIANGPGHLWWYGLTSCTYQVNYDTDTSAGLLGCQFGQPQPLYLTPEGFYVQNSGNGRATPYTRTVTISMTPDANGIVHSLKVVSHVTWKSQVLLNPDQSIDLEDYFYDWRSL